MISSAAGLEALEDVPDRRKRGLEHHNAKLRPEQIPRIRRLLAKRVSMTTIAVYLGVSRQSISNVKHGKTWRHVA